MAVQRTEREEDSNHRYRRRVFVLSRAPAGYLFFFFWDLLQKLREAEKKEKVKEKKATELNHVPRKREQKGRKTKNYKRTICTSNNNNNNNNN